MQWRNPTTTCGKHACAGEQKNKAWWSSPCHLDRGQHRCSTCRTSSTRSVDRKTILKWLWVNVKMEQSTILVIAVVVRIYFNSLDSTRLQWISRVPSDDNFRSDRFHSDPIESRRKERILAQRSFSYSTNSNLRQLRYQLQPWWCDLIN